MPISPGLYLLMLSDMGSSQSCHAPFIQSELGGNQSPFLPSSHLPGRPKGVAVHPGPTPKNSGQEADALVFSPFELQKIINLVPVRLKLPKSMHIHNTFHISRIKPSFSSPTPCHHPASLMKVLHILSNAFCAPDAEGGASNILGGVWSRG